MFLNKRIFPALLIPALMGLSNPAAAQTDQPEKAADQPEKDCKIADLRTDQADDSPLDLRGFLEGRGGYRFLNDPYEKDMSIMETRFQLDLSAQPAWGVLKFKGDLWGGLVTEDSHFDMREGNIALQPSEFISATVGRQILSWGTGDMVFINDLFPKDWVSFYIGRDIEYLNAPSDAAKVSFLSDWGNLDVVFTPQFDPDHYPTGDRLSYYNSYIGETAGENIVLHSDKPNRWFRDPELAWRLYKDINSCELALYGYIGYWKSPGGTCSYPQVTFPDLNVYGASLRSPVAKGVGNVEVGYYQSKENESGHRHCIKNSELRFLTGYTRQITRDFSAGVQYYLEYMMDYNKYYDLLPIDIPLRDEYRHLITLRLTQMMLNQNLKLGIFTYYSPSDADVYTRPNISYKINDHLTVDGGMNIFFGDQPYTFFNQYHRNSNFFAAMRYSF